MGVIILVFDTLLNQAGHYRLLFTRTAWQVASTTSFPPALNIKYIHSAAAEINGRMNCTHQT